MVGCCFVFFSLRGYSCLVDGVKGAKDKNKRQGGSKAKNEYFPFRNVLYCGFCSRWECFLWV